MADRMTISSRFGWATKPLIAYQPYMTFAQLSKRIPRWVGKARDY
jgi:hypothetical protein